MKKIFLFLFAGCVFGAIGGNVIPPELVGVWAPKTSKIGNGLVYDGYAIYLQTNGLASLIEAPPPIGALWHATYNSTNRILTLTIQPRPDEGLTKGMTNYLKYDSGAKTLTITNEPDGILFLHSKHIPEEAFE